MPEPTAADRAAAQAIISQASAEHRGWHWQLEAIAPALAAVRAEGEEWRKAAELYNAKCNELHGSLGEARNTIDMLDIQIARLAGANGFCDAHQPNDSQRYLSCWRCSWEEESAGGETSAIRESHGSLGG